MIVIICRCLSEHNVPVKGVCLMVRWLLLVLKPTIYYLSPFPHLLFLMDEEMRDFHTLPTQTVFLYYSPLKKRKRSAFLCKLWLSALWTWTLRHFNFDQIESVDQNKHLSSVFPSLHNGTEHWLSFFPLSLLMETSYQHTCIPQLENNTILDEQASFY